MKLFNEDLVTLSVKKNKKEVVVTGNVGRLVWIAFAALIAMVLVVKR